jgi:hypothetical protein
MDRAHDYIACCGCYCKTCKPYIDGFCKGCKLGYASGVRDINKAKCKIKICCFKEKKFDTCADCNKYYNCEIFNNRFKVGTKDNVSLQDALNYIKDHGYDKFILKAKNWKSYKGKLD